MIRTKAKGLLLSVMLIIACSCFFACKETKVNVDSIAFQEQSISMLVGDSYSPLVKVLPSYATDKSYKLVSSDSTALSVEGGTITALKASADVKLKVISNENQNINDVISVVIYAEPVTLLAPTGLDFDGETISFVDLNDSSVSSYVLSINGKEIDIGNNTKYSFDSVVERLGDCLYNNQIVCKVKAVGDGKIFMDSEYSNKIEFVKYSQVSNVYVSSEKLYFTPVENATSYTVTVLKGGEQWKKYTVESELVSTGVDLSELTDLVNGAEYEIQIMPNVEEGVFNSVPTVERYTVLGKVSNLNINGDILSWDFVRNAQSYDLGLYKGASLVKQYTNFVYNYLQVPKDFVEGEYVFKIKAKSDTSNTLQGEVSELSFKILPAPQVTAQNNLVSWGSVNDANGYFVTIINGVDSTVVDKKFVVNNTYDVSDFGAGSYSIKVVANGNGTNVLASASSEFVSWNILSNVSLSVANQIVSWTDVGATSYDFVCVANSDDTEIINTSVDSTSYNLSSQYFDAGSYTISVLPKGSGSDFDAKVTNTTITKLADATIEGLSNKKFTINKVTSGISYKIEINKVADAGFEVITLDNMSGNTFTLNDASLNAGEYTAKVFVYGNKANIFDADNDSAVYQFKKLETPTINYSKTTDASGNVVIKIVVGNVDSASSYKLMQNNAQKTTEQEYDISALSAGDYTYTVQAIGNNADVLNSDTTSADKSIKVKKLATPTITFDKTKLEYTINIKEADKLCVENYSFSINGTKLSEVTTANNIVDCSEQMKTATDYTAMAYAVAKIGNKTTLGCDLIIDSESVTYAGVSKISGLSTFKVEFVSENNVQLVVEPTEATALKGTGYKLKLKIGDIELDGFTVKTKTDEESGNVVVEKFTKNIYKAKYDVIEALNEMMAGNADRKVDEHEVSAVISNTNAKIIDSDQYTIPTTFKVLDKVENIVKNGQMIEFDVVENATDYVAVVSLNGVETYIKLDNQYSVKASDDTKNQLSIETLVDLLGATKYKVETAYSIKFVAISDDTSTLANKGTSTFNFKLLKAPDIDIVEQEGSNTKYLSIANNNDNAVQYYLFITYQVGEETKILKEGIYTKTTGNVSELINIDALDGYINAVGKLTIKVCANADTEGEYFNSKYTSTTATKLDVREITVVEGKLQWMADSNAKQYNLTYSLSGTNETKILKLGDANFSIVQKEVDGETIKVCVYDFVDLPSGNTNMLLQVDASIGGGHYLNSNTSSAKAVYKLPTLNINVNAGEVSTVVGYSDILKTSSAEILVDGKRASINIVDYETEQEGLKVSLGWAGVTMSMSPTVLLQYNNMNYETLTIKLYSSDDSTLNSNVATKKIRGLLEPANLDILTSLTTEDGAVTEVVERIVWANPVVNGANVEQYEVVINYNDVNYVYYTTDIGFAMPEYGDTNSNGEKDSGEVDFGAGEYKIKVRALAKTSGNADVTNSKYCAEITITILATPMGLKTQNGNVVWTENSAEYYLARVYLLNSDGTKTLITNASVNENKIDLSSIEFMQTGVYGVTVQSMSNDSKVLASDESDALQIIRLPQVTKYYVDNGELYIRVHKFYTMAEIYLTNITTDETESVTKEPIIISNTDFSEYSAFIGSNDWLDTSITTVLADEDAYIDVKYQNKNDSTLTSLLAEAYTIQVKLYGNSAVKGAIVSGAVSNAYNINLTTVVDEEDVYTNEIVKLATPTTEVSDRTCGQVLLSIPEGTSYNLSYYNDAVEGALEGVHLYQVNITVGTEEHSLLVAEVVDTTKFTIKLIEKNDLKYFIHDGKVFNVIEKITIGDKTYIPFDFNTKEYHYYDINRAGGADYITLDLSVGGSFVLNARFIGDDTKFVQSEVSESAIVKRYNAIKVALGGGVISWDNLATDEEKPLYIMVASNSSTKETYNIVLYNDKFHTLEDVESCLDSSNSYIKVPITYEVKDAKISYLGLAEAIYNARLSSPDAEIKALEGVGGVFAVSIKAHHINGTATDIIPAQTAEPVDATVLPMTKIKLNEGALSWELPYITTGTNPQYYLYNYVLKVYDTSNVLLTQVTLTQSSYTLSYENSKYMASYVPSVVAGVELSAETPYIFEIYATPSSAETYINSMTSRTGELKIYSQMTGIEIVSETLKWPDSMTVQILISYMEGDVVITSKPITLINATTYTLPSSFIDTTNTTRTLVPGYTYQLQIRKKGNNSNYISGFYSDKFKTARLSTIAQESIMTNEGVLTWEHSTIDGEFVNGTTYALVYTYNGVATGVTGIKTNSYTFEEECMQGGNINISIRAEHPQKLTSKTTKALIYKLTVPTNVVAITDTTTIEWDMVKDADGNDIETYMVKVNGTDEYLCSGNQWEITGVTETTFSIQVKAISTAIADVDNPVMLINGEYSSEITFTMPSAVTNVEFDSTLQSFKWMATEDRQDDDVYYIYYTYAGKELYDVVTDTQVVGDVTYYIYTPKAVGEYTNIYLQIKRPESLASFKTQYNGKHTCTLFASGDGSEETPYTITTEAHLRNIHYFLNANYRLESDITLSSTAPITTSTQVFGGVLEGNSKTILVQTTKTYATALFECVGNATFANFTLSKFNIETNLETPVFKLGILANDAINSSFTNIIVVDSSIKVDNASTASSFSPTEIYVGGLVGCATDSTISKCEVMLYNGTESDGSVKYAVSLTITGNGESSVYVGGVVGALLATSAGVANIDDCYSNFDICPYMEPISSIPPVIYIGTMAGLSDGATVTNTDADSEYYKYPFIATDEQPEHLPVKDIIGTEN